MRLWLRVMSGWTAKASPPGTEPSRFSGSDGSVSRSVLAPPRSETGGQPRPGGCGISPAVTGVYVLDPNVIDPPPELPPMAPARLWFLIESLVELQKRWRDAGVVCWC